MATFEAAIPVLLHDEGGYVNDPKDPGGETKYGISKRSYPNEDIKNLTLERTKEIYRRDFWRYDAITSQAVATKVFDFAVNMGAKTANRLLQQACCELGSHVDVDGMPGPRTFAAVNDLEGRMPGSVLASLIRLAEDHYRKIVANSPQQEKFLHGWLARAARA